jgi:hypothetical protein
VDRSLEIAYLLVVKALYYTPLSGSEFRALVEHTRYLGWGCSGILQIYDELKS